MTKIMAGIVLYNPDIDRLLSEVNSIFSQVDHICFCDNGSKNISVIKEKIANTSKIHYIYNDNNLGIGKASNQICSYAEQNGYDWVLMLDHDTLCPDKIVETYSKYIDDDTIGMLCPNVIDKELVKNKYNSIDGRDTEYINRCIQSATFIRVSAWRKCGGFNEWMFIDFVDFDFCKKLEINGYKLLRCKSISIDHQLGKRIFSKREQLYRWVAEKTKIKIIGYLAYKNVFSKERVYYCTRNNIAYIRIYQEYIDKRREWRDFFSRIIRRIIRSSNRVMIVRETVRGIIDGYKTDVHPYILEE